MSRPRSLHSMLLCSFIIILIGTGSLQSIAVSVSHDIDAPQTVVVSPLGSIRNAAEFEPMQGVLIRYPFGISLVVIKEMAEDVTVVTIVASVSQQSTLLSQYQSYGIDTSHCRFLIAPTDSYWTRDYGPWFIINSNDEQGIVDFTYNRPRPNDDAIPAVYAANQSIPLSVMPLETTGGNYMTDGQGIGISTTLVWEENPALTHDQINQTMQQYLGITTYHVVPDVNGDYIKHIDCWGKYLSPDTIMIRQVPSTHPHYNEIEAAVNYFGSQLSCYGTPYHVVRVYTPGNEPYTNSLILNNKVFVPITGSQWDDEAIQSYQGAMPGYEVLGFTGSWESTDAIHCRAMGITDRYMLYISHTPLFGNQTNHTGYEILAKIHPYSGQSLISTSTGVYWKVNAGGWEFLQMQSLGDDSYHAVIPAQENGTVVSYYIHAEDASGRVENHPYIGEPEAYTFIAYGGLVQPNHPPEQPQRPSGETAGNAGTFYTYSTVTTDIDEDNVSYLWDWGDGNFSDWLGPCASGATVTAQKSWGTKGTYSVKVKAKDVYGNESAWSEPLSVTMPKNQISLVSFVEILEQLFPKLFLFFHTFLAI